MDPTFNHQGKISVNFVFQSLCRFPRLLKKIELFRNSLSLTDWDMKLQQTMKEVFPLKSADAAYSKVSGMLATLGDPFTRIITPAVSNFGYLPFKL